MSLLSLIIPNVGEKNTVAEPKVDTAFSKVEEWANGKVGTGNIEAGTVTETMLAAPVQTLLNTKSAFALSLVKKNEAAFTIASGELVVMEKEGSEVKLPAATLNRIVGIYCAGSIGSITVKAAVAATIFGGPIVGATTLTLASNQWVFLEANGTQWLIITGEPRKTSTYESKTYTKAEIEAGVEFSAIRPVYATQQTGTLSAITAGGATAPNTGIFYPGQKFKATTISASVEFLVLLQ